MIRAVWKKEIMTPRELFTFMCRNFNYGWISKTDNSIHKSRYSRFFDEYFLQSPQELLNSKVGVCWDQTEFERWWFRNNKIEHKIIYLEQQNPPDYPTHTFACYFQNDRWYWFEHAWEKYRGIRSFKSLNDLISSVKNLHMKNHKFQGQVIITDLKQPKYGISCQRFMQFAKSCRQILV